MFCPLPFQQMHVRHDGAVHLCCPGWLPTIVGNILETNPFEIWRGSLAQTIRGSILDGSFHYCTNCPFLPGPRGCVTNESGHHLKTDVERIPLLCLSHDPTCNLKCGSCRKEIQGRDPSSRQVQDVLLAARIFDHVDCLYAMGGGDPLSSQLFWELLEALTETRYPLLKLHLHTNGLLLTPDCWNRLRHHTHRITELQVSIDASHPDTYRQLRGGDLSTLISNLEHARAKIQRCPVCRNGGFVLHLNFTFQSKNFREIPAFLDLGKKLNARRITFSALENWGTYTDDEYAQRAVHLPSHPEHTELLEVLRDPRLRDPSVTLITRIEP